MDVADSERCSVCGSILKGDEPVSKYDILRNFKVNEDIEKVIGKALTELDCNFSELMRTSFLLALPQIMVNPSLLKTIRLEGLDISKIFVKRS